MDSSSSSALLCTDIDIRMQKPINNETSSTDASRVGRALRVFLIVSSLAFIPLHSSGQENIKTLREVMVQGQASLAVSDYATAFKAFEETQTTFSQELEVLERVFHKDTTRDHKRIQCYRIVTISGSTILKFHYF